MSETMSLRKKVKAAFTRVAPSRHRPRYKDLFNVAVQSARAASDRADRAEQELRRLRGILADHAKTETIPEMEALIRQQPQLKELTLYPLSFEAYKASLHTLKRYVADEDFIPPGIECLYFKSCRVVSKP